MERSKQMKKVLFKDIVSNFKNQYILVVGDVMLDEYVCGTSDHISAEAPVPVFKRESTVCYAGGAANVAVNLKKLGSNVLLLGVTGRDLNGDRLIHSLQDNHVGTAGLMVVTDRVTTVKTRIMAGRHQMLRIDDENTKDLRIDCVRRLQEDIRRQMPSCTGVIISDYSKGVINQEIVSCILKEAKKRNIPVAYDPKRNHSLKMSGLALVTPNLKEAWDALCEHPKPVRFDDDGRGHLMRLGCDLIKKWKAKNVMVTLGEHGMYVIGTGANRGILYPSFAEEVKDVTGAGDTVVATALLALASGANIKTACLLANTAAGDVVSKQGTAFCSNADLQSRLEDSGMWSSLV